MKTDMKTYKVGNPDRFGGLYWIAQHLKVPFDAIKRANPQLAGRNWALYGGELLNIPTSTVNIPTSTKCAGQLKNDLRKMISGPNFRAGRNYDQVRDRIKAASDCEKREALADQPLLTSLRHAMFLTDFAMAVELLGRQAPTGQDLKKNPVVIKALDATWKDSNVAAVQPNRSEHGGYIFMNLITGQISTATVPPGNWGRINLPNPDPADVPNDTIAVANFHTHPNPEEGFDKECPDNDINSFQLNGVPGLVRAAKGRLPVAPRGDCI